MAAFATSSHPTPAAARRARWAMLALRCLGLVGLVFYPLAMVVLTVIVYTAHAQGDTTFPEPLGNLALFNGLCLGAFLFSLAVVLCADRRLKRNWRGRKEGPGCLHSLNI